MKRKRDSTDAIDVLTALFILRRIPAYIQSDNGSEFVAKAIKDWITTIGARTTYFNQGHFFENGYCERFNACFRDEFLNGEILYNLKEDKIINEQWWRRYNTKRPHSALRCRPPAPEVIPHSTGGCHALSFKLDQLVGTGHLSQGT